MKSFLLFNLLPTVTEDVQKIFIYILFSCNLFLNIIIIIVWYMGVEVVLFCLFFGGGAMLAGNIFELFMRGTEYSRLIDRSVGFAEKLFSFFLPNVFSCTGLNFC